MPTGARVAFHDTAIGHASAAVSAAVAVTWMSAALLSIPHEAPIVLRKSAVFTGLLLGTWLWPIGLTGEVPMNGGKDLAICGAVNTVHLVFLYHAARIAMKSRSSITVVIVGLWCGLLAIVAALAAIAA